MKPASRWFLFMTDTKKKYISNGGLPGSLICKGSIFGWYPVPEPTLGRMERLGFRYELGHTCFLNIREAATTHSSFAAWQKCPSRPLPQEELLSTCLAEFSKPPYSTQTFFWMTIKAWERRAKLPWEAVLGTGSHILTGRKNLVFNTGCCHHLSFQDPASMPAPRQPSDLSTHTPGERTRVTKSLATGHLTPTTATSITASRHQPNALKSH